MNARDEKRAFDAMMDAMGSDSDEDSESESQAKVCVSPEGSGKTFKDTGSAKDVLRSSLQSPDDQPPPLSSSSSSSRDEYGGSPRYHQQESSAIDAPGNQSQSKGSFVDTAAADAKQPEFGGSTPTRAPPKPSRVLNKKEERVVELSRDAIQPGATSSSNSNTQHSSIQGVRSPEFRARYANRSTWTDSDDDDEIIGKRFVLQRSSEGNPNRAHGGAGSNLRSSVGSSMGSVHSGMEGRVFGAGPVGQTASAARYMEASSSDKVRLSEIDAFGSSNPHSRMHTPTDFGSSGTSGTGTGGVRNPDGSPAGTGGGHAADTKGIDGAAMNAESLEATKQWLYRPCSKNSRPLECYVERERSGIAGSNTVFRLYNEQNHHTGQNSRFMMSAKKLKGKTTSYYLISMDMTPDDDRGSDTVLGRVRGNAVGSEYLFTDGGVTAGKTRLSSLIRRELGFVRFNFDSKGPSSTEVWVPNVTDGGSATVWQPEDPEEGMEAKIKANQVSDLKALKNKKPRWDAAHGGHVLNFHGRVTESSVKNFQLAFAGADEESARDDVILQFGKVSKDKFTLDYSWPLSPVQAFGICVASLDGKIADRKGYEFIRSTTNFLFGGSKEKKGAGGGGGKT